jgi:cystathionine beta-lyase
MTYDFDRVIERRGTNSAKWDLAEEGTLPLWVADMDFAAPPPVVAAVAERVEHGVFGYALPSDSYFEAFIAWEKKALGLSLRHESVLHVTGVMPAVRAAVQCFTQPGDGVVVQPPVYFPFYSAVTDNGRRLVRNPLRENGDRYEMDLDQLEEAIDESTRMLILCSPHNPVGRVWGAEELAALADVCVRHEILVFADEIHCGLVLDDRPFISFAALPGEAPDHCIVSHAPSKTFNLAGLPTAQCVVPNGELRRRFKKQLSAMGHTSSGVLELLAAETAYREGEDWRTALLRYLESNRQWLNRFVETKMSNVRMVPLEGTYIPWLDFRKYLETTGLDEGGLAKRIRQEAGVWLHSGPEFGKEGRGFQRINIACPRSILREAMERIAAVLYGTGPAREGGEA